MEIIVFGVGQYYKRRREKLVECASIIAFVDNNSDLWGTFIDNVLVYDPKTIENLKYDAVVVMSVKAYEMRKQLLDLGVKEDKIFYYEQFYGYFHKERKEMYGFERYQESGKCKIAILSVFLDYSGSSIAAVNAACALEELNYDVTLVAPNVDVQFADEIVKDNRKIIEYKNLIYAKIDELEWLRDYEYIIVNTFLLIHCAKELSKKRKVVWWIHEANHTFKQVKKQFEWITEKDFQNIQIYAVSNRCKGNFHNYYPNAKVGVLPLGMPDTYKNQTVYRGEKTVFAIVGVVSRLKSQTIFLQAVSKLTDEEKRNAEFWIIGNVPKSDYADEVMYWAGKLPNVKVLGPKSRKEMEKLIGDIDVMVCASVEESLSMTIIEGMMYKKICVTTDTTGIAEVIFDGANGYICRSQSVDELSRKMRWIMQNRESIHNIKTAARRTFEDNFTLHKLGERLEKSLKHERF